MNSKLILNELAASIEHASITPDSPVIIDGNLNFLIINIIKYVCLISFIFLSIVIIVKMLKHKKINKILIILTGIFLLISFLAFFTDIYDSTMRIFLPYYYGV